MRRDRQTQKEENNLCQICMSRKVSANIDCCRHQFCNKCIKDWVKGERKTCPVCRRQVNQITSIRTGGILYRVRREEDSQEQQGSDVLSIVANYLYEGLMSEDESVYSSHSEIQSGYQSHSEFQSSYSNHSGYSRLAPSDQQEDIQSQSSYSLSEEKVPKGRKRQTEPKKAQTQSIREKKARSNLKEERFNLKEQNVRNEVRQNSKKSSKKEQKAISNIKEDKKGIITKEDKKKSNIKEEVPIIEPSAFIKKTQSKIKQVFIADPIIQVHKQIQQVQIRSNLKEQKQSYQPYSHQQTYQTYNPPNHNQWQTKPNYLNNNNSNVPNINPLLNVFQGQSYNPPNPYQNQQIPWQQDSIPRQQNPFLHLKQIFQPLPSQLQMTQQSPPIQPIHNHIKVQVPTKSQRQKVDNLEHIESVRNQIRDLKRKMQNYEPNNNKPNRTSNKSYTNNNQKQRQRQQEKAKEKSDLTCYEKTCGIICLCCCFIIFGNKI